MSTREHALHFVRRLAEDDHFREAVQRDPVAAAAEYGFRIDPSSIPAGGVVLPSKESLGAQAESLAERFHTSSEIVIIFGA